MKLNKKIKSREDNITKVIIERNNFHPNYFTKHEFRKDFEIHSGGYDTLLAEILSIYIPDLDRFDKTHDIILSDIYNEVNILNNKIEKLMKLVRENKGYTIKMVKEIFEENEVKNDNKN